MKYRVERGFTLFELLVVIAIIAILFSMIVPTLGRVKAAAHRAQCQSNQKQWGYSLHMYGGDHADALPDNSDGDLINMGSGIRTFWREYLLENPRISTMNPGDSALEKSRSHVLFCPTERMMRYYETLNRKGEATPGVGYFVIFGGSKTSILLRYQDTRPWAIRTMMNGVYRNAPLLGDKLLGYRPSSSELAPGDYEWARETTNRGTLPSAAHQLGKGVPLGGNFLHEDGHVDWWNMNLNQRGQGIKSGAQGGIAYYFFKIPVDEP